MLDIDSWEPPIQSRDWRYIVLHHSATAFGSVATIDAEHCKRRDQFGTKWSGIGYHLVIGNGQGMLDGRIEPTFRWEQQLHGAHAGSRQHNLLGIGVCLIGDFDASPPTPRQTASLQRLLDWICSRYGIAPQHVLRHSDIAATRCPGRLFPFAEVQAGLRPLVAIADGHMTDEMF